MRKKENLERTNKIEARKEAPTEEYFMVQGEGEKSGTENKVLTESFH